MSCTPDCRAPTPAQAHCTTCHRTFGGVWGFDAHRKNGQCVDPVTLGYIETDRVWRTPMSEEARQRLISIRPR
jgi:hypothetical protein